MDSSKPRQQVPQPKANNLMPPTYTVPDVTLMFDSDDSLIWKPGEVRPTVINQKVKSDLLSNLGETSRPVRYDAQIYDKENSPLSKAGRGSMQPMKNTTTKSSSPLLVHNLKRNIIQPLQKIPYNPQVYASSNQGQESALRVESPEVKNKLIKNIEKVSCSENLVNNLRLHAGGCNEVSNQTNTPPNNNSKSDEQLTQEERIMCKKIDQQSSPTYFNSKVPSDECINKDSYLLKLIEGQNQQILYLHKVLEKILETSNNGKPVINNDHLCNQCSRKCNETYKNAYTQTSSPNYKPETRNVATNTDISWEKYSLYVEENKKTIEMVKNSDLESGRICHIEKYPPNNYASCTEKKQERSLTSKDVIVPTMFGPPSPDPSHCVNIPELNHQQDKRRNDSSENEEDKDSPLVGESALAFSERLKNNNGEAIDDASQEEKNGVTFYNKVMINVQQVLHRYGNNDMDQQMAYQEQIKETEKNMATGTKNMLQSIYSPTNQQLQQFGISFLDPITLKNKHKQLSPQDDILPIPPGKPFREESIHGLHILHGLHKERQIMPHGITDAELVSLAQKYQGVALGVRKPQPIRQEEMPLETEFSFATKNFLGKYKLDN